MCAEFCMGITSSTERLCQMVRTHSFIWSYTTVSSKWSAIIFPQNMLSHLFDLYFFNNIHIFQVFYNTYGFSHLFVISFTNIYQVPLYASYRFSKLGYFSLFYSSLFYFFTLFILLIIYFTRGIRFTFYSMYLQVN